MFDVKEFVEEYFKATRVKERDGYTIVTPHFFHIDSDESIALKFSETEDGRPILTDCGTTRDYLELSYINLSDSKYKAKLDAIKERFFVEEDEDGALVMTIPTTSPLMVMNYIGYFIQAISIIANIDLTV